MTITFDVEAATSSFIQMLRSGLGPSITVFDHRVASGPPTGYLFVTGMAAGEPHGSQGDPESIIMTSFQADAASSMRKHAQWISTRTRTIVTARSPVGEYQSVMPTVPAWVCADRKTVSDPGHVTLEGARDHPIFVSRVFYELTWVPA